MENLLEIRVDEFQTQHVTSMLYDTYHNDLCFDIFTEVTEI